MTDGSPLGDTTLRRGGPVSGHDRLSHDARVNAAWNAFLSDSARRCQVSKPDPLALAREFVATVEKFDSVPFMMTSYDAGKLAIDD